LVENLFYDTVYGRYNTVIYLRLSYDDLIVKVKKEAVDINKDESDGVVRELMEMHEGLYKDTEEGYRTQEIKTYELVLIDMASFWPWLKQNVQSVKKRNQDYILDNTQDLLNYISLLRADVITNTRPYHLNRQRNLEVAENAISGLKDEYESYEGTRKRPKPGNILVPFAIAKHLIGDNYMGAYLRHQVLGEKMSLEEAEDDYKEHERLLGGFKGYKAYVKQMRNLNRSWAPRPVLSWTLGEKYLRNNRQLGLERGLIGYAIEKENPDVLYNGHVFFNMKEIANTISEKVTQDMDGRTRKKKKNYPRRISYYYIVNDVYNFQPGFTDVESLRKQFIPEPYVGNIV